MRCRLPNVCSYRYNWKEDEARKQILRTHTTAVSARMLYEIANVSVCVLVSVFVWLRELVCDRPPGCRCLGTFQQPGGFKPVKLFSIDRVFRNESLDATHLAEFHQVEGVVADYGLGLGDLIGVITEFFSRIGKGEGNGGRLRRRV